MVLSWSQALAWRMRRQLLDPVGTESVEGVVCRLGAVPAHPDAGVELAVRIRRERSRSGEVAHALAEGRIVKTYAFRGATHLLTPEDGGAYLALRAASRMWELPGLQSFYGLTPSDWPLLRGAVRAALAGGPMTREELGAAVTARPELRHLGFAFADRSETLLKPLAWQGDMSFGPPRDGGATLQRLDHNPRWAGLPDLDKAGVRAVEGYFRAYGPATPDHLHYWLDNGLGRDARDECRATPAGIRPMGAWPGHSRRHVVPPARRTLVSRGARTVIVGGVVSGTWSLSDDQVLVVWFAEAVPPGREALAEELARLATILDRPLRSTVQPA